MENIKLSNRKFSTGDIAQVLATPNDGGADIRRLLGKNVVVQGYEGSGWYTVKTPRGQKTYSLRAGSHI